jgi:anti-sigma factor RsiW
VNDSIHPAELLSAYLDGELDPAEHAMVATHLAACDSCRAEAAGLSLVRGLVRNLPMAEPPAAVLAAPLASDHPVEFLSAFLDGELATGEFEMVAIHLDGCSYCRDELREVDTARTATRSLPVLEVPESTITMPIPITAAPGAKRRQRAVGWIAAAAAASVLVAGVAVSRNQPVEVDLDMLANRHVARVSVQQTFTVVPVLSPAGGGQ